MDMEEDHVLVVRHHNRILRKVNKALRSSVKRTQEQADENFLRICESQTDAEMAIEKLWTFGGFHGPLDLDVLVDTCLKAIDQYKVAP